MCRYQMFCYLKSTVVWCSDRFCPPSQNVMVVNSSNSENNILFLRKHFCLKLCWKTQLQVPPSWGTVFLNKGSPDQPKHAMNEYVGSQQTWSDCLITAIVTKLLMESYLWLPSLTIHSSIPSNFSTGGIRYSVKSIVTVCSSNFRNVHRLPLVTLP